MITNIKTQSRKQIDRLHFQIKALITVNFSKLKKIIIIIYLNLKMWFENKLGSCVSKLEVSYFALMWLPSAAYLAVVQSFGINQFQSGSAKIKSIFLVDTVFERLREKNDNILEN